ncbi:MAG: pstC, partial [Akkermansiaceae bacterium]|nr:pstC [Akkermansiaceae bacterium]
DTLSKKYQELLADAPKEHPGRVIPKTPHLTAEERGGLFSAMAARDPLLTDDPPLITTLQEQLAAKQAEAAVPLTDFRAAISAFSDASSNLDTLIADSATLVKANREAANLHQIESDKHETLMAAAKKAKNPEDRARLESEAAAAVTTQPIDLHAALQPVLAKRPEFAQANTALSAALKTILSQLPASLSDDKANHYLATFRKGAPEYERQLADTTPAMNAWKDDAPVSIGSAVSGFLTGKKWVTGGGWQDFYGIVPLFVGSLIIALIALALAIPLGVGAAIYTNQLAGKRQQNFIKPTIEFLQAIPSVVLGFLGIAVLGTWLQDTSAHDAFSWLPGFPIQQRLNMFTAGCLLGLMAIPTIFSLSEDALNNVPSAFAEASDALGASKLQTIFRVVVPAGISGILAAVLLGLGRVIGETMVVLLVAGNRIAIPDFTEGLGTFFQPAHTLTGIIAQELGEVPFGSVHYRALFVVGLLLFMIVLAINWIAQRLMRRFQIGQH